MVRDGMRWSGTPWTGCGHREPGGFLRRAVRRLLPLLLVPVLAAGPAGAQEIADEGDTQEGALFLLLPVGAQGVGLGRAMTALRSNEASFWNPAGIAEESERRVLVYRGDQLSGTATAASFLFPWQRVGTFGLSYVLLDVGDQNSTDDFGNNLGSISVRNHLAIASFATSLPWGIQAGANLKLVQFRIGCRGQCRDLETTSSAYGVDVGVQAQPFSTFPLRFGWMLAHAGTEFESSNEEQSLPLPTRLRFALAYQVLHRVFEDGMMDLWATVEAEDRARDPGSPSMYLGLNYSAADLFFVRAGYVGGELDQTDGATVGLGLRIDRVDLNLAWSLTRSTVTGRSRPIHVSLGVAF